MMQKFLDKLKTGTLFSDKQTLTERIENEILRKMESRVKKMDDDYSISGYIAYI